jgi:hypothetical protein
MAVAINQRRNAPQIAAFARQFVASRLGFGITHMLRFRGFGFTQIVTSGASAEQKTSLK